MPTGRRIGSVYVCVASLRDLRLESESEDYLALSTFASRMQKLHTIWRAARLCQEFPMKVECGTPDERKSAAIATSSPTSFGFASSAPLDPPTPALTSASLSLGERFATHSSGRRHSSPQREVALPTRVHSLDLASSFIRSPPRPPTIRVDIVSVEPQSISFTAPDIGRRVHAH